MRGTESSSIHSRINVDRCYLQHVGLVSSGKWRNPHWCFRMSGCTHEIALISKGIKAGDLRRGCEGLDIWNSWGNYCVAPKSIGSQTMNKVSSHSQHVELTSSWTGGTDQFNASGGTPITHPDSCSGKFRRESPRYITN